jgi:hypothetical protein
MTYYDAIVHALELAFWIFAVPMTAVVLTIAVKESR